MLVVKWVVKRVVKWIVMVVSFEEYVQKEYENMRVEIAGDAE
jgi:hypothetical protein